MTEKYEQLPWCLKKITISGSTPLSAVINLFDPRTDNGIDNMKKIVILGAFLFAIVLMGAGCVEADIASENLSKAADQFEINRRIVFYNGITTDYILTIEGRCSLGNYDTDKRLSVTCKTGDGQYKKHFLGLSDNVTYFVEQIDGKNVSKDHYKVIFKPSVIIPDIDLK